MNVLTSEQGKKVTNFIIIAAPLFKPMNDVVLSPTTKRQQSQPQEQQQGEVEREEPTGGVRGNKRRYPKDDYQKNITINVVKCCIRQILSHKYKKLLKKQCQKCHASFEGLVQMVAPVLKEVVISLGDLKKLLTQGEGEQLKLKRVFAWFLQWYLRKRYMHYLLNEGKMDHKDRYVDYKNKYMLYLLQSRDCFGSPSNSTPDDGQQQPLQ